MSKKNVKIIVTILQVFLVAALLLPAGRIISNVGRDDTALSVYGMIARYAGMGFSDDARLFVILACALPTAVVVAVFVLRERYNFGTAAVLCAFYSFVAACFLSAASQKMVDDTTLTFLPYLIIIVALSSLLLMIYAFLISEPAGREDTKPENLH